MKKVRFYRYKLYSERDWYKLSNYEKSICTMVFEPYLNTCIYKFALSKEIFIS